MHRSRVQVALRLFLFFSAEVRYPVLLGGPIRLPIQYCVPHPNDGCASIYYSVCYICITSTVYVYNITIYIQCVRRLDNSFP